MDDGPGIHLQDHSHDSDASDLEAPEDGPMDRRRAPEFRKQGSVYVDGPLGREGKDLGPQDVAVGYNH
jgi:hypothetical protein